MNYPKKCSDFELKSSVAQSSGSRYTRGRIQQPAKQLDGMFPLRQIFDGCAPYALDEEGRQ